MFVAEPAMVTTTEADGEESFRSSVSPGPGLSLKSEKGRRACSSMTCSIIDPVQSGEPPCFLGRSPGLHRALQGHHSVSLPSSQRHNRGQLETLAHHDPPHV